MAVAYYVTQVYTSVTTGIAELCPVVSQDNYVSYLKSTCKLLKLDKYDTLCYDLVKKEMAKTQSQNLTAALCDYRSNTTELTVDVACWLECSSASVSNPKTSTDGYTALFKSPLTVCGAPLH